MVNGKRTARVHAVRAAYDATCSEVMFADAGGDRCAYRLGDDTAPLGRWFTRLLGFPVSVCRDDGGGFPDDAAAPGPTIVSTATLEAVASWFPGLDVASVRRRLRTNVEIAGVPAFWEDALYARAGESVPFALGEVRFEGTNPCQRCVVPSRDPESGEVLGAFTKRVAEMRAATLPPWAERSRFDHFYRLAVNTRAAGGQQGRRVRRGDGVLLAPLDAAQPA